MLLEDLGEPYEVREGAREAVDLVDQDALDQPGLDVGNKLLQRGSLEIPTRESTVVVISRQ